jgi:predicted dehydrogenase
MTIRVAAIEVSHWHALFDAAYLRHLVAMPDVELVAIQDSDPALAAKRAAAVGNPPTFTDHNEMLAAVRPDFVVALGRHKQMAAIAHDLLDQGYPFLMEKPMGINAAEVEAVAAKAAQRNAFVAVPLAQRYGPFAQRGRELIAAGRLGPLSHIYVRINRPGPARYRAWDCAWMLDPAEAGGGCLRNLGSHGFDLFLHLTGEEAEVTGAQLSRRAHDRPVEDYASVMLRSASGILGTVEVGNGFPRDGTDGEWKLAGRDGILTMKDGVLKLATASGDETFPGTDVTGPYFTTVRDALDHWQRGAPPPVSVHDCARAVRLIDQAYARAGGVLPMA